MQIEYINKNLINFLFWFPASPLKLQNLELKTYFRAENGEGIVSHMALLFANAHDFVERAVHQIRSKTLKYACSLTYGSSRDLS